MCGLVSSTAGFQNSLICDNEYVVTQKLYFKSWEKAPACKCSSTHESVQHNPVERFMIRFIGGQYFIDLLYNQNKAISVLFLLYLESSILMS